MDRTNRDLLGRRAFRWRDEGDRCSSASLSSLHSRCPKASPIQARVAVRGPSLHSERGFSRESTSKYRSPSPPFRSLVLASCNGRGSRAVRWHCHLVYQRPAPCTAEYLQRTCRPACNGACQPQPCGCGFLGSPHREALVRGKDSVRV